MKTTTVKTTRYTTDLGVELNFKPANDEDVIVAENNGKLYVRYLVRDDNAQSPEENQDDGLFLVNYHRNFEVCKDSIITKEDVQNYYCGSLKVQQQKKYWLFKLNVYIHSGVVLGLAPTNFPDESWDVSHVGLVLVTKKEWKTEAKAREAAKSLVNEWNQYLSGDVWGMCTDVFDLKTQELLIKDSETVWGCYDYQECLKQLKIESET